MPNFKWNECKTCGEPYKQYNSLVRHCSPSCKSKDKEAVKKAKIKPKSDKRKVKDLQYYALRKIFLEKPENRICPITGFETTEIHHKYSGKDRDKYYLVTETWLAVSREGHNWIHENPKEAREKRYLY